MRKFLFFAFTLTCVFDSHSQVQSPSAYLGYELGSQFSRHHQVVDYFEHLADESDKLTFETYGKTYEGRSLNLAYISSEANLKNIEQIREDNLIRTGLSAGEISTDVSIVWLSYNVHGNESVSTEASMITAYELLKDGEKAGWLENALIIIDPCVNPDGRERYVNFYYQKGNQPFNPNNNSWEHNEPWHSGRTNHYMFDLNRDWAWQSQIESQQRIKVYNNWLPHVHVDFHEMGVDEPYYFAPAAEPYHEQITSWQRSFQEQIGSNHAKYFDQNNWLYYTSEVFDLLYPSYGDTYPTFNGAIGMTYEQGGSGRAGLGVINQIGDTLTLADRIAHHKITGLSTVEVTVKNSAQVIQEFENFYRNPKPAKYKSYVLKYDGNQDKFEDLKDWLRVQGIEFGRSSYAKSMEGYHFGSGQKKPFKITNEDLVISTNQPKAVLTTVLFEPQTEVVDSLTYDITAWSIPYAYGLEAYATSTELNITELTITEVSEQTILNEAYGYIFHWKSMKDAEMLSALLSADLNVRYISKPLELSSGKFDRGSFLVTKADNSRVDLKKAVSKCSALTGISAVEIGTGLTLSGPDLGSDDIRLLDKPHVGLIGGEGVETLRYGAIWHYFEQELHYPVTTINTTYIDQVDLSEFDVLILPSGNYENTFGDNMSEIIDWVDQGGKLIAMQGAIAGLVDSERVALTEYNSEEEQSLFERRNNLRDARYQLLPHDKKQRDGIQDEIIGAVFKVNLDNTHPLAYGYSDSYYSLKTTSDRFGYLPTGNVGTIRSENAHLSGFAGMYAKERTAESLVFGVENLGSGEIVYMVDDPLFRSFWYGGELLFANAIFMVGN